MEKIFLFGTDEDTSDYISKIAGNMRIKVSSVPFDLYENTIGDIIENKAVPGDCGNVPGEALMLFCEVSEKHLDSIVAKLRRSQCKVDYKAVITRSNRTWSVKKLFFAMEQERKAHGG